MHDFMQSLQMRCPVAATIGLSTQIIASAPIGQPSARSLWNSEIFSSSGQPASVTPNGALLERVVDGAAVGRLLLEQPVRARVLALLVAPDAVVRLVEGACEVGAAVGQREALAPAQRDARRELPRGDAVHVDCARAARASCSRACAARGTARRPCARPCLPACARPTPRSAARRRALPRARPRPAATR